MARSARERMVGTAAKLFSRHGYHAVGFRRIVEESGAPRGSIYHHFPGGKEQLGVEAVRLSGTALVHRIERIAESGDDLASVFRIIGERLAVALEASEFADGCPVATVALECVDGPDSVAAACRGVLRDWVGVVAARLVREGWEPDAARSFATTVVAAFEGALLLAKAERNAAPVRTVAEDLASRVAS